MTDSGTSNHLGDTRIGNAYAAALRSAVRPDCAVVNLDAGAGRLSVLACQAGARVVYAIDAGDVINVAREVAAANGFADRIECIQGEPGVVTLPERADVIVSALPDSVPALGLRVPVMLQARRRWLAPGGVMLPARHRLYVAVASAPDAYARHVSAWSDAADRIDLGPARRHAVNTWCSAAGSPLQLLTDPHHWASIDYASVESQTLVGESPLQVHRDGLAHGLLVWFDSDVTDGVDWSDDDADSRFGSVLFPWEQPVELRAGDSVDALLRADVVAGDYVWQWRSRATRDASEVARFSHSTFLSDLRPLRAVRSQHHKPAPNSEESASSPDRTARPEAEAERIAQALSPSYWARLAPALSVEAADSAHRFDTATLDDAELSATVDRFRTEGYFRLPPLLPLSTLARLRDGVEALRRSGWPPVFAFVYDEAWRAARCAPVSAFLARVLGPGFQQIPHIWTHYVEPAPGASGWPPHFDNADRSNRVTVWIPLTDATLDNGCMYVVPRSRIPSRIARTLPDLAEIAMADYYALLHGTRALPVDAGGVLGWAFDVMHWGSICTRHGDARIALSLEFITRDATPATDESPLLSCDHGLPTFAERLDAIGRAIIAYQRFDLNERDRVLAASIRQS